MKSLLSESKKIILPAYWDKCPDCWKNFYEAELKSLRKTKDGDVSVRGVNRKLKHWNAKFSDRPGWSDGTGCITFKTDEEKLAFVMRWS